MVIYLIFLASIFVVFYTYIGYPLLLYLITLFCSRRSAGSKELPCVTLVIAAYNEEEVIAAKLEESLSLDYPDGKLQIVVAADGSSDATPEIVRQFQDRGVKLCFHPPRNGKLSAIINAREIAEGSIIVVTDANNRFTTDAVRHLAAAFADPRVGAACGAKHIIQDGQALNSSEGLYWKYESFIKLQESQLGSLIAMPGEILAFRKHLVDAPDRVIIMDDIYFTMQVLRKGFNIAYRPEAKSFELTSATAKDEFERRARSTAGRYEAIRMIPLGMWFRRPVIMWQYVSHKIFRLILPFAMLLALVTNLILVIYPPEHTLVMTQSKLKALLGLQFAFYAIAVVGSLSHLKGPLGKLLYLPTFIVSSNLAGISGFFRHILKRQKATWRRVPRQNT